MDCAAIITQRGIIVAVVVVVIIVDQLVVCSDFQGQTDKQEDKM